MQDADNDRPVDRRYAEQLINQPHRALLVVHPGQQVGDSVNHHQVDAPILVIVAVHGFQDTGHALPSGDAHQAKRLEPARGAFQFRTAQDVRQVFVKLVLRLFRIVEQHPIPVGVVAHGRAQGIYLRALGPQRPREDTAQEIRLPAPFRARDADEVPRAADGDGVDGDSR